MTSCAVDRQVLLDPYVKTEKGGQIEIMRKCISPERHTDDNEMKREKRYLSYWYCP
jgi:hypothetical protein